MKEKCKIKRWQLLRFRGKDSVADLTDAAFLSVGKRAFARKKELTHVILPRNCLAVKAEAFRGCCALESVVLPTESTNLGISSAAFRGCAALSRLENSAFMTHVGDRAFADCTSLGEIEPGRDLRRLGEEAFRGCTDLQRVYLPSSLSHIGKRAFADCTGLVSVEADEGLSALAPELFRRCIALTEAVFPAGIREVPRGAYRYCLAIERISVPSTVTRIRARAFSECYALTEVTFELGTARIGAFAFAKTPNLRRVVLPHTLKKLGFGAFGLGRRSKKPVLVVDNEYMLRRMRHQLRMCGSARCVELVIEGKSIEERKRERRRTTIEQTPTHLFDEE